MAASSTSISQRAQRVLQREQQPQRSDIHSGITVIPSIPSHTRCHMWKRLYLLAELLLRFMQRKIFLTELMGEDAINPPEDEEEYEKIYVDADLPHPRTNKPWRVMTFQGEKFIVGKEMTEGRGMRDMSRRTHDPAVCQHPSDLMHGRGGRGDKRWWSCQACGTRWERIPLASFEPKTDTLGPMDRITFGKYMGKTYNAVYQEHPEYCAWILQTAETGDRPSQQLTRFARYLTTRETRSTEDIPPGRMDEEL
jgi:hypothetical protein